MDGFDIGQGELVPPRDRPNLTFEEGSYTLPELLESHLLPVVAQYDSTRQPIPFHEFNFDLSQPLLLYKKRNIQKVVARSLQIEDEKYDEVGESLLIPEDYKGWFAVLQRITGNIKADDTVPHFTTVEEIANSNTDRFLIGGTKKINGLQLLDRSDPQLKHEQRHFLPGDILTREKIYYGETKKRTRLFRKPKYITEKFLMCRDECDREILLPFEQTGIFYQVSHKSGKANKHVMQMSDIVARKLTPRVIKLVFGRFPVTPCSFTGIMRAESSKIETSIIACTLINTKNILMEIPVSSAMYFRVAVMNNDLRTNACYRNAMTICAERAITYMRNIKVCYNFTMDDEDETFLSGKECDSDPQTSNINSLINNNNNNTQPLTTFKQNAGNKNLVFDSDNEILRKSHGAEQRHGGRRGFSVDISDDITLRPGRCLSAGRVSFCLGNNYLTVPMFEHGHTTKRDSGNNNSIHEAWKTYTTKRGSRLSFNGTFFEEVEEENETEDTHTDRSEKVDIPPSIPCTNISSYVNMVSPPEIDADTDNPDYIPAAGTRRPSTQPPDTAPPPLPRSSSTSGVSSGSLSSVSDETLSKRASSGSFEYAVPKAQDPNKSVPDTSEITSDSPGNTTQDKPLVRRPSTFTFSEGCFGPPGTNSKLPICQSICDIDETTSDDGSPIYENIEKLMELVAKIDNDRKYVTDDYPLDEDDDNRLQDRASNGNCLKETLMTSDDVSTENECSKIVGNCEEKLIDFCERSNISDGDGNLVESILESCESNADNVLKAGETEKNGNENIVKAKVRRTGVTERENEVCKLKLYCDSEMPDPKKTENSESNLENEYNQFKENSEQNANFDENITNGEFKLYCDDEMLDREKTENKESNYENDCNELNEKIESTANCDENVAMKESHDNAPVPVDVISAETSPCVEKSSHDEPEKDSSDGRSRLKIALEKMKNSNELMVSRGKIRALEKPINCLDVDEIAEELACIGIKEGTIEHIREMGVDGATLSEVLDGDLSIRDCLDGVNLVDQQKISMFLRGWRPNNE